MLEQLVISRLQSVCDLFRPSSLARRGTWITDVDAFIVLSEHSRRVFIKGGISKHKLFLKPNFVDLPKVTQSILGECRKAIYVGQIRETKGARVLLQAWRELSYPLRVVGDGPLLSEALSSAQGSIQFTGHLPHGEVLGEITSSSFVLFPSITYENMPRAILEAFPLGRPVVASRLGAMAEMVRDGETGLLFESGNPQDLREKVMRLIDTPGLAERMGKAAHTEYLAKYTPQVNYEVLMKIYNDVLRHRGKNEGRAAWF